MMYDIICAAGAALIFAIAFLVPILAKRHTQNLLLHEQFAQKFFDKVDTLLSDPDTPTVIFSRFEFMSREITDTKAVKPLLSAIFHARSKLTPAQAAEARQENDEISAFFKVRPELGKAYHEAIAAVMGAIFFNGAGIAGIVARHWVNNLPLDYERTVEAFDREIRNDRSDMVPA